MPDFLGPIAGFGVTLSTMFKKPETEFYPEEKRPPTAPGYHGRHQLNRYADGLEKCIGCELCAWACPPADAIYVEGADNTEEERFSPGERYGRVYQINYLRCIGCGLCVEACPTRSHHDQRVRDDRRQPSRIDLREGPPSCAPETRHGSATTRAASRHNSGRLLPRRHHSSSRTASTRARAEPGDREMIASVTTTILAEGTMTSTSTGEAVQFWILGTLR